LQSVPFDRCYKAFDRREARSRANAARTAGQMFGVLVFWLGVSAAWPADHGHLIACTGRLARVAARLVSMRERILSRCSLEALECDDAAARPTCREEAGRRCAGRLDRLAAVTARMSRVDESCIARLGTELLDDDGLGYDLLAPYCRGTRLAANDARGAITCQRRALDCTAERTIAVLAPRTAELLAAIGAPAGEPGCLTNETCGDGALDASEECDQGAFNSDVLADRCRTSCREPGCGDGVVDEDEECDDGNVDDGDGCDADCLSEVDACGNGILDEDEECDDGNAVGGDGCDDTCAIDTSLCGDGLESDDEECDDGPANSDVLADRCRTTCRSPSCGDGVVDPDEGEDCEPPRTLLCTEDCENRVMLPIVRSRNAEPPLGRCARGILRAGLRTFAASRTVVGTCVRAAAHCVLGRDVPGDRCLAAAGNRCDRAFARGRVTQAKAQAVAARACVGSGGDDVLMPMLLEPRGGLGFRDVAAGCPFDASRLPLTQDLLGCVTIRAACLGERAIAQAVPRAYELLGEIIDDPDGRFPCVPDPDDLAVEESASGAFAR
jgi:cysteine-rich repeat protein